MKKLIPFVFLSLIASGAIGSELIAKQVAERTKPVGEVCIEGDACATATVSLASNGPRSGEQIYQASCTACHAAGVAGAPLFGDLGQWQPRIDKGMDTLLANSISGINAMPPKGLCMDCSDDELQASIQYMIDAAK
ncbi:MAG: cytochrome c5 family protein [Pseudomonadales bacterium]